MKIAFFTDVFLPKIDGAITSLLYLANELTRLNNQVLIVAPKPKKGSLINLKNKKIKLLLVSSAPGVVYPDLRIATPSILNLTKKIRQFNPDVIHANTPLTLGINSILIAKALKKPLVATLHSPVMDKEFFKTLKLKPTKTVLKFVSKYTNFYFDRCDLVFAPSSYLAKRLKQNGLKSKVVVLSNGVKIPNTNFKKPKNHPLTILYVGRLGFEKNIDVLIKTAKILKEKIDKFSLQIVGDGPAKKDLQKLVQKENLQSCVSFLGSINHDLLLKSKIYPNAHLFVSASTCEVQPVSFIEAMFFNLPIIAPNQAGSSEIVKNNGLLVEKNHPQNFAKAILKLYHNKKLYQKIQKNIKKNRKKYQVKNIAQIALKYYQSLQKKTKNPSLIEKALFYLTAEK